MDAEVPAAVTPAKKAHSSGCLPALAILAAILVVGVVWTLVAPGDSHSRGVSRAGYGTTWPLTVDSATIGCADGRDPYVQVGSIRYALDGAESGYAAIDSIWADDPSSAAGLKVSLAPLRADALKLC